MTEFIPVILALVAGVIGCIVFYLVGKNQGYTQSKVEFDEEVQGTALAKVNRILHDANRSTLPREDTTGPATVHRGRAGRKPKHRKKS